MISLEYIVGISLKENYIFRKEIMSFLADNGIDFLIPVITDKGRSPNPQCFWTGVSSKKEISNLKTIYDHPDFVRFFDFANKAGMIIPEIKIKMFATGVLLPNIQWDGLVGVTSSKYSIKRRAIFCD